MELSSVWTSQVLRKKFHDNTVPFTDKFLKGLANFLSDPNTIWKPVTIKVALADIYSDWSKNKDLFSISDTKNSKVIG